MKNIFLLIALFMIQNLYAQDKIFTKDNQDLTVKIVEQTDKLIKYKLTDFTDGPIFSIKNSRIEKIEYSNGLVDLLGNQNPRKARPFGINAGLSYYLTEEAGYFLLNMDYFILPQVDLQINVGAEFESGTYFSIGSRFHLNSEYSESPVTPFTGVLIGLDYGNAMVQIPLGVNYLGEKGFNISLSVNKLFYINSSWQSTFIELTFGYKFKI